MLCATSALCLPPQAFSHASPAFSHANPKGTRGPRWWAQKGTGLGPWSLGTEAALTVKPWLGDTGTAWP